MMKPMYQILQKSLRGVACSALTATLLLTGCTGGTGAGTPSGTGGATKPAVTTANPACDPGQSPVEGLPPLSDQLPELPGYLATADSLAYYRVEQEPNEDGSYTIGKNFSMELFRRAYFNRYELTYSSTQPLKCEISYRAWDRAGQEITCSEVFYLEKGKNATFVSFTDGYLDAMYAFEVTGLTVSPCRGSSAVFTLHSLTTACRDVISKEEFFMENEYYRVGVLAAWGGGISYIEDKNDGDDTLGNLINRADTGRLIQQSYYGVGNGPNYTASEYNGQKWNYNPVQGGDQYGNCSKLIDLTVSEDGMSVYVKCRPMDWAKNGSLTPSYMENTYTLKDNTILVSNRFVDFFGVTHPAAHAELPAFYVVSHLSVFHYYNGTKPWTKDAYISLPDEPFWAGNQNAYHNIVKGNTETWAAWTNTDGYGIGLFVPGTEIMLAGRHAYNGSKDPLSGATNYVAPLRTRTMVSFVPFSYDYVITTGTVDQMRDAFETYWKNP